LTAPDSVAGEPSTVVGLTAESGWRERKQKWMWPISDGWDSWQ